MKRLYTMSATQDGIPKRPADHRYNTVRLLTPRVESRDTEVFKQNVFYGLEPVTSQEQLLRSVLLYSVDKAAYFTILCKCNLTVQNPSRLSAQTYPTLRSHSFRVRLERQKRRKWVEVDLASFLQPFLDTQQGDLHMVFTYRCAKADPRPGKVAGGRGVSAGLLRPSLLAPSLLLFLNDTREQAHQGWLPVGLSTRAKLGRIARLRTRQTVVGVRSVRRRRGPEHDGLGGAPAVSIDLPKAGRFPHFQYPAHECQLHDFRLSFSQLRWDRWIIAPHNYNPRYCKGSCPRALSHRYGSPVHTLIQNILYEKVDSSIPRPSCVPSKYNPLSVLTLENDGSIVYKEYEDMIATTCTCR
ncbi:growth/differentiatio [Cetorhinus maximus]